MRTPHVSLVLVALLAAAPSYAVAGYRPRIPNGNTASCLTCHVNNSGDDPFNAFGKDVLRQDMDVTEADLTSDDQNQHYNFGGPVWNIALCNADSDNDGQTNGQELGDPDCTWTIGATPGRSTAVSNPGNPASTSTDPNGGSMAGGGGEGEGEGEGGEGGGESGEGEDEDGSAEGEGEGESEPSEGEGEANDDADDEDGDGTDVNVQGEVETGDITFNCSSTTTASGLPALALFGVLGMLRRRR